MNYLHYPSLVKFKGHVFVKICLKTIVTNVIASLHNEEQIFFLVLFKTII